MKWLDVKLYPLPRLVGAKFICTDGIDIWIDVIWHDGDITHDTCECVDWIGHFPCKKKTLFWIPLPELLPKE